MPMTFVRLWGCNFKPKCAFCDTLQEGQTWKDVPRMTLQEIARQCSQDVWVCITGGEPTIHAGFVYLTWALRDQLNKVAVETNGTRMLTDCKIDWVCVSPKGENEKWPAPGVLAQANEIKLLVSCSWKAYGLYSPSDILRRRRDWIYDPVHQIVSVQPVWDDEYDVNLRWAMELAQEFQVRLSVQTHKLIGVK